MSEFWRPFPQAGDVVQCRFPEDALGEPGPKERPGLVLEVEAFGKDGCVVRVAYGTSKGTHRLFPGEFVVPASDPSAGLAKDTKFDLGNSVRLRFDSDWFAAMPARRFGVHPKRGHLDLQDMRIKRGLQSAIREAKEAGRL